MKPRTRIPKRRRNYVSICKVCGKEVYSRRSIGRKVCSFACNNIARKIPNVERPCRCCGRIFRPLKTGRARTSKFCTRACYYRFCRGENSPLYRGNRRQDRGRDWQPQARLARDRDGNTCQCCNSNPGQRASVDHIVPYRLAKALCESFPMLSPNDLRNLLSLCRSCHGKKTPIEPTILAGDVVGFISAAKAIIPLDKLLSALHLYGLHNGASAAA